jgi:D-beta-D-heptose 7-phosphate kinase/D-beta-D-heptose 1-phosphate adenosyltransferase
MKKVCFINGCFDVLHYGHLKMIKYGYENSDFLIVAIDSDKRIKNKFKSKS